MGSVLAPPQTTSEQKVSPFAESRYDMLPSYGKAAEQSLSLLRVTPEQLASSEQSILEALKSTGFFVLRTSPNQIGKQELLAQMQTFFKRPIDEKQAYNQSEYATNGGFCGYAHVKLGKDASEYQKRLREYEEREVFDVSSVNGNAWPSPEFETQTLATLTALHDHSAAILVVLAKSMGIEPEGMLKMVYNSENHSANGAVGSNFAMFRYQDDEKKYSSVQKCMAHQDSGFLTLLPKSTFPGIEILNKSNSFWWSLEDFLEEDDILVYSGRTLEKVTGGVIPATIHRVVRFPGQERFSMPFELKPFQGAQLEMLASANDAVVARQKEIELRAAGELAKLTKDPQYVPDWVVSLPLVSLYSCRGCGQHIKQVVGYKKQTDTQTGAHYYCDVCFAASDKSGFNKCALVQPLDSKPCTAWSLFLDFDTERVLQQRYRVDPNTPLLPRSRSEMEGNGSGQNRFVGCLSGGDQGLYLDTSGKVVLGSRRRPHR
jgi:isopenicillin N synthase-like dioxygenase